MFYGIPFIIKYQPFRHPNKDEVLRYFQHRNYLSRKITPTTKPELAKQHAGITNSQSTDFRKLDFHFNASLAAVNLAKAACKRCGITYSISSYKSFIHNTYMLKQFICMSGLIPDMQVIDKLFKEPILFTARAAWNWQILTNY